MAALRGRVQPAVGSRQWIQDENAQIAQFCGQEAEDFAFSARNEVEWLNEHMVEIFSKEQMNVADVFKTPGKLRGKTPRTARKRNPLEVREPLSDIFSTSIQPQPANITRPSPSKILSPSKFAAFKVAEDAPLEASKSKTTSQQPIDTADPGHHGIHEDEMDVDEGSSTSTATQKGLDGFRHLPSAEEPHLENSSNENSTTDRSFHSAREDVTKRDLMVNANAIQGQAISHNTQNAAREQGSAEAMEIDGSKAKDIEDLGDDSRSSSQDSSPAHGLVRKSSLTFATLPAREPITTKKSIGSRLSRTSQLDQLKGSTMQGSSLLHRLTGGKSIGPAKGAADEEDELGEGHSPPRPILSRDESDSDSRITKLHNKSSTQRLHERINLLSKSQPPQPKKSMPATHSAHPSYPDLSRHDQDKLETMQTSARHAAGAHEDEDDDDWINSPQKIRPAQQRPQMIQSFSADKLPKSAMKSGSRDRDAAHRGAAAAFSAQPNNEPSPPKPASDHRILPDPLSAAAEHSTTPVGSPSTRKTNDGHLSASKLRLQSIMKTAKGLFSSSASASAQAKLAAMSPSTAAQDHSSNYERPTLDQASDFADEHGGAAQAESLDDTSGKAEPAEPRRTRSSTEKEARDKARETASREQVEREKEKVRMQESAIQANAEAKEVKQAAIKPLRKSPRKTQTKDQESAGHDETTRAANQSAVEQVPQSQAQKYKDVRRPTKPAKDAAAQSKAPPVNIRIGMPSRRVPLSNSTISSSLQDSLHPSQNRAVGVVKKGSNASISSTGPGGSKAAAHVQKPKALLAAERKKEQDEKEAQRKLEQKREIERRRQAQQEETRRQDQQAQRQEAEKQREKERAAAAEDAKKLAQKQAIEKRRLEMQRKEQQRPASRADNNPAHQNVGATSRSELGGNRPPSRQAHQPEHYRPTANQPSNSSKAPIKRVFDPETDTAAPRPPKSQGGQNYQQHENKRRRTNEEETPGEAPTRPTMAPPIRQSGIRKEGPKASVFGHNYSTAPPPAAHHAQQGSLLKSTTTGQAYQQHLYNGQQSRPAHQTDTSKYRDGNRIPFAENANAASHHQHHQPSQPFKTPLPSKIGRPSRQSPHYPNGENIQLQEIPTDSEDDDSSPDTAQKRQRAASLPDWVRSPFLNDILRDQEEHMDADAVFGPVGSPHLEEMFRERAHKFRSRTSSANWSGQDRLTQEEVRRDVEARARIRREGGWTFNGST